MKNILIKNFRFFLILLVVVFFTLINKVYSKEQPIFMGDFFDLDIDDLGIRNDTFTIDQDDDSDNIAIKFGSTSDKKIQWDKIKNRFFVSDDLTVDGDFEVRSDTTEIRVNSIDDGDKSTINFQDNSSNAWGLRYNDPTDGNFSVYNYINEVANLIFDKNNRVGIGGILPKSKLTIYNEDNSLIVDNLKTSLSNAGINIATNYTDNSFTPGLFWSTENNNPEKPKAGVWLEQTSNGTKMNFGTSNNYTTGITNNAITVDQVGNVGIGTTTPAFKLDVNGLIKADGEIRSYMPGTGYTAFASRVDSDISHRFIIHADGKLIWSDGNNSYDVRITHPSAGVLQTDGSFLIDGNVGIGTTTPTEKLEVAGNVKASSFIGDGSQLTGISISESQISDLKNYLTTELDPVVKAFAKTDLPVCNTGEVLKSDGNNFSCIVDIDTNTQLNETQVDTMVSNNRYLQADANGNVGIGTTTPTEKLEVAGNVKASSFIGDGSQLTGISISESDPFYTSNNLNKIAIDSTGKFNLGSIYGDGKMNITGDIKTIGSASAGSKIGSFGFYNAHSTWNHNLWGTKTEAEIYATADATNHSYGADLHFALKKNQSDTVATDVMIIKRNGNVGIGTGDPEDRLVVGNGSTGIQRLAVDAGAQAHLVLKQGGTNKWTISHGDVGSDKFGIYDYDSTGGSGYRFVIDNGGNVGIGTTSPSTKLHVAGTITEDSDERLKENITTLENSLEKISKIRGVNYFWKDQEKYETGLQSGVIAQEVEEYFPEVVYTANNEMGTKSVNYNGLIPPLIEAVKELKRENEKKDREIEGLKIQDQEQDKQIKELRILVCLDYPEAKICQ